MYPASIWFWPREVVLPSFSLLDPVSDYLVVPSIYVPVLELLRSAYASSALYSV